MSVLIKPIITEKMTADSELHNRYGFVVDPKANKIQIKDAVEATYDDGFLRVELPKAEAHHVQVDVEKAGGRCCSFHLDSCQAASGVLDPYRENRYDRLDQNRFVWCSD